MTQMGSVFTYYYCIIGHYDEWLGHGVWVVEKMVAPHVWLSGLGRGPEFIREIGLQ